MDGSILSSALTSGNLGRSVEKTLQVAAAVCDANAAESRLIGHKLAETLGGSSFE